MRNFVFANARWYVGMVLCVPVGAQVTQRASVASSGLQGSAGSSGSSVSADGRFVAFASTATNLVPGDTNGYSDVFVRDRQSGSTELVSVDSNGAQGNGDSYSYFASVSADGRYVAFRSSATNLVPGSTNGHLHVFVRDRQNDTTELVSVDSNGVQGNDDSYRPSISADGRYVAFDSIATNLVPGDNNGFSDVFVRDRQNGTTERVSLDSTGTQGNGSSYAPSISGDGHYVAFSSLASNLVPVDANGTYDVFVRDRQSGTTELVSVDSNAVQGNGDSDVPAISGDGRFVAFTSFASNLVTGDTNGFGDVFVHDRQGGTTVRVSVDSTGEQGNGESGFLRPAISADGRFVAFHSLASNLVALDTNGTEDVFVHDRQSGTTERVSLDSAGVQGNNGSFSASLSANGRYVTFDSVATNLVPGDTNGSQDIFIHDRDATGFTSICDPSVNGVVACPCSNPPAGPGRGCNNSSATGGAILSASGIAYLSMDSLVFATSSEKPTATSIVLQGNALAANGVFFGQGVRCVGGTLKRLYTKTASGGSITAPNFGAGDPSVSARSAALGDLIQSGQSRWYLVYYRDPVVLGGCPLASTFNATQSGQVTWWP